MNTSPGKINVGDMFKKGLAAAIGVVQQSVIQAGSKIPAVQKEIESQKLVAGKSILWKYFPYIILTVLGIFMIARIK